MMRFNYYLGGIVLWSFMIPLAILASPVIFIGYVLFCISEYLSKNGWIDDDQPL